MLQQHQGYIVHRWKVGNCSYVQVLAHRVCDGVVVPEGTHAHHRNHLRNDNRPENLEYLSSQLEHSTRHLRIDIVEAISLYKQGWSFHMLSKHYGITSANIKSAFKHRGVQSRTQKEAWIHRRGRQFTAKGATCL